VVTCESCLLSCNPRLSAASWFDVLRIKGEIMTRTFVATLFASLALGTTGSASLSFAASLPTMPPDGYDKGGQYPAGKVETLTYHSSVTNGDRTMEVYTPPGYSATQKYPAIYAIHGVNAWPDTIFADWCVGASAVSDNLLGQKKIQPVIIVAMDDNNVDTHSELFDVIIPYIESHYPVIADADHRGIYGYSLGGGATFAEGIGHLDTFHHISPSSAAPFNHPSDADMFPNDGAEAKAKIKTLFISCGDADWDGFYPPNQATHEYCDAHSIPNYWLSVAGGGHDGGVWRPAMWNFLQLAFPATSESGTGGTSGAGGNTGAGGSAAGGATGAGGKTGAGGSAAGGVTGAAGGVRGSGGSTGTGGSSGTGGSAAGGSNGTGGAGSGGRTSAGGASGSGGATSSGGTVGTGGAMHAGGVSGHGGASVAPVKASAAGCTCGMGRGASGAHSAGLLVVLGALLSARLWRRTRPGRLSWKP
jgi:enterochelin esterase-like enzyme